ncbi:hypothetical protein NSMM_80006 [Nitrosomonas mobilis]|uniref:Uncharacterized protein n=1 Tax=Nitrosomonas mobilis TaxID=51642 RepID=A0A1G5SI33_9PROT|nr:hypothetical protein NSMM_80006 [Nitrosomonas mobilis]
MNAPKNGEKFLRDSGSFNPSNPSLKRSANGMPPAPGLWPTGHFHSPGAGVLPSSPA